jgi:hypothetical protein
MQALEIWRTASNKRDAVALVTDLNSESTYLERLCRSRTDRSTDESVVTEVLPTRLAIARRIATASWKGHPLRSRISRFAGSFPQGTAAETAKFQQNVKARRPLKAVGNAGTDVVVVLTTPPGINIQVRNSGIKIASLETRSPAMPKPNI